MLASHAAARRCPLGRGRVRDFTAASRRIERFVSADEDCKLFVVDREASEKAGRLPLFCMPGAMGTAKASSAPLTPSPSNPCTLQRSHGVPFGIIVVTVDCWPADRLLCPARRFERVATRPFIRPAGLRPVEAPRYARSVASSPGDGSIRNRRRTRSSSRSLTFCRGVSCIV